MQIGIMGLGLIGGSLGLALKNAGIGKEILGYDLDEIHARQALSLGLADEIVCFDEIRECDVIFLCMPVEGIISALQNLKGVSEKTTIIDMGSTKEKIIRSTPQKIRKNFVAAHPMCGIERFGPHAAFAELYKGQIVVLCNGKDSGEHQFQTAKELFLTIGMKIVKMEAHEHDRHAAFISHMPHAASYSLANSVLAQEDPEAILVLAGGGFKDMSRIAKSSPDMWTDVFKQNKDFLLESMDYYEKELRKCKEMVEKEEWDKLHKWMESAVKLHEIL